MPANPDGLVLRVVQVDALGNSPWDEPIEVTTDGIKLGGVYLVETGKDDKLAAIWRDGQNLRFRDEANPGSASGGFTLADLLAGGGGDTQEATVPPDTMLTSEHRTVRHAIHFVDQGPAEGFASGAFKEVLPAGSVFPTSVIWYTDSGKTEKIVEKLIERSAGSATNIAPTPITWILYDTDGTSVLAKVIDSITYSGVFEYQVTRTIKILAFTSNEVVTAVDGLTVV
jgi:hypothetical protein